MHRGVGLDYGSTHLPGAWIMKSDSPMNRQVGLFDLLAGLTGLSIAALDDAGGVH